MPYLTVGQENGRDIALYYKDWGTGPAVVFSHGWPLSSDAWEGQMMFLAERGFRCIAHDRRGHGRSDQPWRGHDMDTYADDLAHLVEALDLRAVTHVGHSTGGGEVVRYLARHGTARAARAVLVGAVPPLMLQTADNPLGLPVTVFDDLRAASLRDRAQLYREIASGPFYGYNRPGTISSPGVVESFCQQGMQAAHNATYACIAAFSATDFSADLAHIDVPTLLIHGDDDQIVPIDTAARAALRLLPQARLDVYAGGAHGLASTARERLNADLLAFLQS